MSANQANQFFDFPSFQWKFAQFFCISDNWRTLPFNVCFIFNADDVDAYNNDDGFLGAPGGSNEIYEIYVTYIQLGVVSWWACFGLLNEVQLTLFSENYQRTFVWLVSYGSE